MKFIYLYDWLRLYRLYRKPQWPSVLDKPFFHLTRDCFFDAILNCRNTIICQTLPSTNRLVSYINALRIRIEWYVVDDTAVVRPKSINMINYDTGKGERCCYLQSTIVLFVVDKQRCLACQIQNKETLAHRFQSSINVKGNLAILHQLDFLWNVRQKSYGNGQSAAPYQARIPRFVEILDQSP